MDKALPEKLRRLYSEEEQLREKGTALVDAEGLALHLSVVEHAMDLSDLLRQHPSEDEDFKVLKVLGMRCFNAFGASTKLCLSGYHQNGAMVMRDILETVFLLDLFRSEPTQVARWRNASRRERLKNFRPVHVRKMLDDRDGLTSGKRGEMYRMFSELAGHPTMVGVAMMRPQKDGDAVIGPFMEAGALKAVLAEMGRLGVQVGEVVGAIIPADWQRAATPRQAFEKEKQRWLQTFYGH